MFLTSITVIIWFSDFWNPAAVIDVDEDEDAPFGTLSGRDGVIFLIDAGLSGNSDNFRSCLECIVAVMKNRIIQSEKDLVSEPIKIMKWWALTFSFYI